MYIMSTISTAVLFTAMLVVAGIGLYTAFFCEPFTFKE